MNFYVFQADVYCEECGSEIRQDTPLPDLCDERDEPVFSGRTNRLDAELSCR